MRGGRAGGTVVMIESVISKCKGGVYRGRRGLLSGAYGLVQRKEKPLEYDAQTNEEYTRLTPGIPIKA